MKEECISLVLITYDILYLDQTVLQAERLTLVASVYMFIHTFVFVDPSLIHNHWIQELSILQRSKYQLQLVLLQ
jgi:hypothetical protein